MAMFFARVSASADLSVSTVCSSKSSPVRKPNFPIVQSLSSNAGAPSRYTLYCERLPRIRLIFVMIKVSLFYLVNIVSRIASFAPLTRNDCRFTFSLLVSLVLLPFQLFLLLHEQEPVLPARVRVSCEVLCQFLLQYSDWLEGTF